MTEDEKQRELKEKQKEKYNAIVYTLMQGKDYLSREISRLLNGRNPKLASELPNMSVTDMQRAFIGMVGLDETIQADQMYNPRMGGKPLLEYQQLIDKLRTERGLELLNLYDQQTNDAQRQTFYKGLSGLQVADFQTAYEKSNSAEASMDN